MGNVAAEAVVLGNLAALRLDEGYLDEAQALLLESLETHDRIGELRFGGIAHSDLALLKLLRSDAEAARSHAKRAQALLRDASGDTQYLGIALIRLAMAEAASSRPAEARDALREAGGVLAGQPEDAVGEVQRIGVAYVDLKLAPNEDTYREKGRALLDSLTSSQRPHTEEVRSGMKALELALADA